VKWATSVDEAAKKHEAHVRAQMSVYLVPPDPKEEEESAPLQKWFSAVFERELESWYLDEARWPQRRDLKTFLQWFDVWIESVVVDLGQGPLEHEDW